MFKKLVELINEHATFLVDEVASVLYTLKVSNDKGLVSYGN